MSKANEILGNLYYIHGKQKTNFRIFTNFIKKDGSKGFTKWVYYLDATDDQKDKATHRTILENEIVLDFDPLRNETIEELKKRVKQIFKDIENKKIYFKCYFTGSRGYHFHIYRYDMFFMSKYQRQEYRNLFIDYYKAEAQKNTENVPIALEGVPHWKSGKIKKRCFFNESFG